MKRAALLTPDEVVNQLTDAPDAELLIARGHIKANPPRVRVGILALTEKPALLLRAYVRLEDEETLFRVLDARHRVRRGGWEDWLVAWTNDEAGFAIWDKEEGRRWWLEGRALVSSGRTLRGVRGVEAFASEDWVEQGVRVRLEGNETLVLWSHRNVRAELGFDYDGVHLDWDMGWAKQAGRALATRLGVAYLQQY